MKRKSKKNKTTLRKILILCCWICMTTSANADIVELRTGKLYENVKVAILRNAVLFNWDQKPLSFKKSEVRRIKLRPVLLKQPTNELERLEYEAERIRVAEALQSTVEWEMSANSKPALAILQLSAGGGVEVGEVESVTNLIRTSLVKTKLFTIVDVSLVMKDCPKDTKDCSKHVADNVKVNKIITGTITKLGKKYLINGNVLDSKKNTIDFAEKASADSTEKLEEASEYFAKKIAGGIMEYWDEAVSAKEQETYASVQYAWRSALIPGWGQLQYGKDKEDSFSRKKGIVFGITTFVLIANLYYQGQKTNDAKNTYESTHNLFFLAPAGSSLDTVLFIEDNNRFTQYEKTAQVAKMSAGVLIGFYIFNIGDALLSGKSLFGAKKQTSGLFFFPSKSYAYGTREENYTIGFQFQF
jgi:TolB-like protein